MYLSFLSLYVYYFHFFSPSVLLLSPVSQFLPTDYLPAEKTAYDLASDPQSNFASDLLQMLEPPAVPVTGRYEALMRFASETLCSADRTNESVNNKYHNSRHLYKSTPIVTMVISKCTENYRTRMDLCNRRVLPSKLDNDIEE